MPWNNAEYSSRLLIATVTDDEGGRHQKNCCHSGKTGK
jgi:hypothetical protein